MFGRFFSAFTPHTLIVPLAIRMPMFEFAI
jgi:hypothetical protein